MDSLKIIPKFVVVMVSVIIPTYNTEAKLLNCAIDSALSNECVGEVIVVDDCSTTPIANNPGVNKKEVTIIRHSSNLGPRAARETGISAATGDAIFFLDADDMLGAKALDLAYERMIKESADIVQMRISYLYGRRKYPIMKWIKQKYDVSSAIKAMLTNSKLFPVQQWGKLYRMHAIKNRRQIEYSGIWGEDRLFNLSVLDASVSIVYEPEAEYQYHMGDAGLTSGRFRSHLSDIKKVYQLKKEYIIHHRLEYLLPDMEHEMMKTLEYEIRMRINYGSFSQAWLNEELASEPWCSLPALPSAKELEQSCKYSAKRIIKKTVRNILK